MAALNKLTALQLRSQKKGRYSDGGGLYLSVTASGSRSWVFVWKGKAWVTPNNASGRREMGLGRFGDDKSGFVSLKRARQLAAECRDLVQRGIDPQRQRKEFQNREAPKTFGEIGHGFIDLKETKWRNPKHRGQWRKTVDDYCAVIKNKPVSEIVQTDVLDVLNPLWTTRHETARRVLGRVSNILGYAIAKGLHPGPNPAEWKGRIEFLVEEPTAEQKVVKHHAALDYEKMPEFVAWLHSLNAMAARAFLFLIFTATRTSETLNAQWDEIDFDERRWLVPAERMKLRKEHVVPLSDEAIQILSEQHETRVNEFIFPSSRGRGSLSNMSMLMLLRRHKIKGVTPHGMRATFRSWVHDTTNFDPFIAEQALAHRNPDQVEAAYLRSTAFLKRSDLMQAWADYCVGQSRADIIDLEFARNG